MKQNKQPFEDDGRTIANMNIEGMPWYNKAKDGKKPDEEKEQLSPEGQRAMMRGVLLAALAIGGVFVLVFTLFILFCVYVWFA